MTATYISERTKILTPNYNTFHICVLRRSSPLMMMMMTAITHPIFPPDFRHSRRFSTPGKTDEHIKERVERPKPHPRITQTRKKYTIFNILRGTIRNISGGIIQREKRTCIAREVILHI